MAKKKKTSLRDIKLVYRHSSVLLRCAVVAAVVFGTVTLLALTSAIRTQQGKMQQLRREAYQMELENAAVRDDIRQLGTVESVKKIASSELGLADPNTTFFCPAE